MGTSAISARQMARCVASASARAGRVRAWNFGAVCPSASARRTSTSITSPFSACMQIVPPLVPVLSSARKMLPSSSISTPRYAMNSLNEVMPWRTSASISDSTWSVRSVMIMWKP